MNLQNLPHMVQHISELSASINKGAWSNEHGPLVNIKKTNLFSYINLTIGEW